MSVIPEHTPLSTYDQQGKMVCFLHHQKVCYKCCVDFSFMDDDDDDESQIEVEETQVDDDERVFILVGGVARFIPQEDEQLHANAYQLQRDYDNRPSPDTPGTLNTHYCAECQLTWLVGKSGKVSAESHPSHHASYHQWTGTSHSLLVFVDGACPSNGPRATRASIGVYFGPQSRHNRSQICDSEHRTSQSAEIESAIEAMRYIRTVVLPERRTTVMKASPTSSKWATSAANKFRLVLATDSSYLVECVCKHMEQWTFDERSHVYRNKKGDIVKNGENFQRLRKERDMLAMAGIQIVWYHVPRRFNAEADQLANLALLTP